MAKRGRKGKRKSRRSRRKGVRSVPKTVGGVWRAQPLLVKGGMALSAFEIGTGTSNKFGSAPSAILLQSGAPMDAKITNTVTALKENAMDLNAYKPLAYGVVAHYVAKKLKVKGL